MKTTFSIMLTFLILVLFAIAPAIAQEGQDEWEPNDTMSQADSIDGLVIDGEIGRHGDDDDWFMLNGQEGYNPTITLLYDDADCDIDAEIYSGNSVVGTLTSTSSPDSGVFDVEGTCYIHVYIYQGRGDYTIEIAARSGRDRNRDRNRDCEGPDEVEPNDSRSQADLIEGFGIEGYACEDEDDWFALNGQEGFNPYIEVDYDDDECDIDVEVYSGRDLIGTLSSIASPDGDYFDIPDECYLHVMAYDGEGEYYISIEPESDNHPNNRPRNSDCEGYDEVEPNDSADLADPISGMTIEGYACEGDHDWFMLQGQEGRRPYITLTYNDNRCDIDLEIYSDDEYIGSLSSVSSPDSDEFRIPGTCYIHVSAYEGEGDYTIEIED